MGVIHLVLRITGPPHIGRRFVCPGGLQKCHSTVRSTRSAKYRAPTKSKPYQSAHARGNPPKKQLTFLLFTSLCVIDAMSVCTCCKDYCKVCTTSMYQHRRIFVATGERLVRYVRKVVLLKLDDRALSSQGLKSNGSTNDNLAVRLCVWPAGTSHQPLVIRIHMNMEARKAIPLGDQTMDAEGRSVSFPILAEEAGDIAGRSLAVISSPSITGRLALGHPLCQWEVAEHPRTWGVGACSPAFIVRYHWREKKNK